MKTVQSAGTSVIAITETVSRAKLLVKASGRNIEPPRSRPGANTGKKEREEHDDDREERSVGQTSYSRPAGRSRAGRPSPARRRSGREAGA